MCLKSDVSNTSIWAIIDINVTKGTDMDANEEYLRYSPKY